MHKNIDKCRICGNTNLVEVVDLGMMMLTGVFPRSVDTNITSGPISLVKCSGGEGVCGLLQLRQSYDLGDLYGMNYGYRSGLNKSMVEHLHGKVRKIESLVNLKANDLIVDIGSNDGTTLAAYPEEGLDLVGIDPTGLKFKNYYRPHIKLIPDFFSREILMKYCGKKKAKVVTSFSMFYDLEAPLLFMKEVRDVLDDEGIWVFEQSYMPTMLKTNSFDTICQEHLEYYAVKQIKWMADKADLKIIDVEFNNVNGGSFSVMVAKRSSHYPQALDLEELLNEEIERGFDTLVPYREFAKVADRVRNELLAFIDRVHSEGKTICGLGASTKGNVLLQYCGITADRLPCIGEVNAEKFGAHTPGTFIPIISESDLLAMNPDYLLVLPWHFRSFFTKIPKFRKVKLVFPLPQLEVV
ncbi:MAG: methyltransferase domain-containing protein [Candidatus Omnitrophica bacterium]|nr:methyltransferase domain-containing protein [Candidatus Omnitrophota bacterium]